MIATQNPIEQEGTYPLSEAQTDRFMIKEKITYPSEQAEWMMTPHRAFIRSIAREEEIVDALADLLRRRRGA